MKKIVSVIIAMSLLLGGLLTGCSGDDTTTEITDTSTIEAADTSVTEVSDTTVQEDTKPFDGVTLNYLTTGKTEGLEELLTEFEENTGIHVVMTKLSLGDMTTKMNVEFSTKTSTFDVVGMTWEVAQGYARGGNLLELNDYIDKYDLDINQYVEVYVRSHMFQYPQTADGAYVCLPHQADVFLMVYRADLFEDPAEMANFKAEYGYDLAPPETYEQMRDVAEFFTRDTDGDGENDLYGCAVLGESGNQMVGDTTPYIRSFGADWIDETMHPAINNPEAIAALEFYYSLWEDGFTPPAANTYGDSDKRADFKNGKIAMMHIWPGQVNDVESAESSVAGKLKYTVVEGKAPPIGGHCVAIPKYTRNPEAAFVFIDWLTSTDTALRRARSTGFAAAAAAVFTDPEVRAKYKYTDAFNESLKYGEGWPQIGECTSIWMIGREELSAMMSGQISIEQACANMETRIDQLMRDGGYYD